MGKDAKKKEGVQITVNISPELWNKIKDMDTNDVIEKALKAYL